MFDGDVLLVQTDDDGDINNDAGFLQMTPGFETAVYLSWFGGNEQDDGGSNTAFTWWGNIDEVEPSQKYRSQTQHLLQALPNNTANLLRLEDAAKADLQWMLDVKAASSVEVITSVPALNRVKIVADIEANGLKESFEFTENWEAMGN